MSGESGRRRLRLLTGCTGVGKTGAAVEWALAHGAEIVSCDALLFYRGMDIGTAKPTAEERRRVPHHLIDVLPVSETMDVGRYAAMARQAVEDIAARGKEVLVVGGSGFYLQSFLRAVTDDVHVPPEVRVRVKEIFTAGGLEGMVAELRRLDPAAGQSPDLPASARPATVRPATAKSATALDLRNPRRVAAALERCLASGLTVAELAARFRARPEPFADWEKDVVELALPPEELNERIARRAQTMVAAGLMGEVERLQLEGLERNPTASRAIGYRECLAVRAGRLPERELAAAIAQSTRQLVKKQRTWFRTQLPPHTAVASQEFLRA